MRGRKLAKGAQAFQVGSNRPTRYGVTQKINGLRRERAFVVIKGQIVFSSDSEEFVEIPVMLLLSCPTHCDIIHVYKGIGQILVSDNVVHNSLEARHAIGYTEWDSFELVKPASCFKRGVRSVVLANRNLMVSAAQIDGAEDTVVGDSLDHLVYARQRIRIKVSVPIDRLGIVDDHTLFMILVGSNEHLRAPGRIAGLNDVAI